MLDSDGQYLQIQTVNDKEKGLGITVEPNNKFDKHISNIINKAHRVFGRILKPSYC